jgi:hypothetical protein
VTEGADEEGELEGEEVVGVLLGARVNSEQLS